MIRLITQHKIVSAIILTMCIVLIVTASFATKYSIGPVGFWGDLNTHDGLAMQGYDVVSYTQSATPTIGNDQFSTQWRGAKWLFSSSENLTMFQENPEQFTPKFGGYCAEAVTSGITVDGNPHAFTIKDGNLFLFFDENVKKEWDQLYTPERLQTAQDNWDQR